MVITLYMHIQTQQHTHTHTHTHTDMHNTMAYMHAHTQRQHILVRITEIHDVKQCNEPQEYSTYYTVT